MGASYTVVAVVAGLGVAVIALLLGEHLGVRWLVVTAKPLASLGFVGIAWHGFTPGDGYGAWVVVALVACLTGDVLLLFPAMFKAGLFAFLLGHAAFIAAFHTLLPAGDWPIVWSLPVVAVSVVVAGRLLPHLGRMRGPVVAYVAVISVMVWGAISVGFTQPGLVVVAAGAVLFYASDLSVARDRFVARGFINRAWGLPAYYLGQVLLALSVYR